MDNNARGRRRMIPAAQQRIDSRNFSINPLFLRSRSSTPIRNRPGSFSKKDVVETLASKVNDLVTIVGHQEQTIKELRSEVESLKKVESLRRVSAVQTTSTGTVMGALDFVDLSEKKSAHMMRLEDSDILKGVLIAEATCKKTKEVTMQAVKTAAEKVSSGVHRVSEGVQAAGKKAKEFSRKKTLKILKSCDSALQSRITRMETRQQQR
jgi:hypothetical protein